MTGEGTQSQGCREIAFNSRAWENGGKIGERGKNGDVKKKKKSSEEEKKF